ncbi:MAG: hypothetical protein ACOC1K_01235 [Nanoarchaeota archaeon]
MNIPVLDEGSIDFDEAKKELNRYSELISNMEIRNGEAGLDDLHFLCIRLEGVKVLTKLVEDYSNIIEKILNEDSKNDD